MMLIHLFILLKTDENQLLPSQNCFLKNIFFYFIDFFKIIEIYLKKLKKNAITGTIIIILFSN
jgi:hypothetical protein